MAKIHLIIGPVGAGKTTFALRLSQERRALFLNLDEWMTVLFRPDRPATGIMEWYIERTKRCKQLIQRVTESALCVGTEVILEVGLILRNDRDVFFRWLDSTNADLRIYSFDAARDVRRARVETRNAQKGATFSMEVPLDIFELASDLWQPLEEDELVGREVVVI